VLPRYGVNGYLVGSNYIWGWETNRIARELLSDCGGSVTGDRYLPIGSVDVERVIEEIRQKKPDFVLNNLIGPSSYAFLAAYRELGEQDPDFLPAIRPVVSCNLTEAELDMIGEDGVGHLSTAIYFESLDSAENRAFLVRARQRFGAERRVSAFFATSYFSVRMLAEAIREAGSDDPEAVQAIVTARSFSGPLGDVQIDRRTNHTALRPHLGRIVSGGRFEIVESAVSAVAPDPYLVDFNPAELNDRLARPNLRVIS
jgi:ABC-type branched-subunit amino acid transport system substrate-binding protein